MSCESTTFEAKLFGLHRTVALIGKDVFDRLSRLIASSDGKPVIAVGSGGSVAGTRYFERCRTIDRGGPTRALTPLEFVQVEETLVGTDVWLFSASGSNPDMRAAFHTAAKLRADRVILVTTNAAGDVAHAMEARGDDVVVLPVAEPKDGFLATHSLVAMVFGLLFAFDRRYRDPNLREGVIARCQAIVTQELRDLTSVLSKPQDTLLIIEDPRLAAVSAVVESSCWEAALCPAMVADIRNFAHGRHTWIARRGESTVVLALLGRATERLWSPISSALPTPEREVRLVFGECGMVDVAYGIVEALRFVASLGRAFEIDPASPGYGDFARTIYGDRSIEGNAGQTLDALEHKNRGKSGIASEQATSEDWQRIQRALRETTIRGVVLDYDGTIVSSADRFAPPVETIARELDRLARSGLPIGIATGRGGSAGEDLRLVLPVDTHDLITVGYYNGGYLHPLSVDIRTCPVPVDQGLAPIRAVLEEWSTRLGSAVRDSNVQITIEPSDRSLIEAVHGMLIEHPAITSGALALRRSGHSLDIVSAHVSKRTVVDAVRSGSGSDPKSILTIGDSGAADGNDFDLLSYGLGISVGEVCGERDGAWTIFGTTLIGPAATIAVLRSIVVGPYGEARLDW